MSNKMAIRAKRWQLYSLHEQYSKRPTKRYSGQGKSHRTMPVLWVHFCKNCKHGRERHYRGKCLFTSTIFQSMSHEDFQR